MSIIITGSAGFIGMHTCLRFLENGHQVIGIDNHNDYYDISLKEARLNQLKKHQNFTFYKVDISDIDAINKIFKQHDQTTKIIHLAAQAGVRYSLNNPYSYVQSNVMGQVVLMEAAKTYLKELEHFVYASSSSVYGLNEKTPFATQDQTDQPASLYAATKKSVEMIAHVYAHLYKIPCTGLRFFTVYGPWGRPDMSPWLFTEAIFQEKPIKVFNHGNMKRDFTYIDDIVSGIFQASHHFPKEEIPFALYNLGNHKSENLMDYISVIENAVGKKAKIDFLPMQKGDVEETFADIDQSQKDFNYLPTTSIKDGIPRFVEWYREYHQSSFKDTQQDLNKLVNKSSAA